MVSINTIQSFVKASGVKSILQTKPNTSKGVINPSELKFAPLKNDTFQLTNDKFHIFSENWKSVLKSIKNAEEEPYYNQFIKGYEKLSEPEKCIAAYCEDDFSTAVNLFLRYGKKHSEYEWFASQGLTGATIPKYKEALKFALENTDSIIKHKGNTFRWQMGGTFESRFKNAKIGDTITDNSFLSTSSKIEAADSFRIKYNRTHLSEQTPVPELIVIKGKNGKVIPEQLSGFRSYEKEVLYNADTKYKIVDMKTVSDPSELGLTEQISRLKEGKQPFSDFIECNVIYLEEI